MPDSNSRNSPIDPLQERSPAPEEKPAPRIDEGTVVAASSNPPPRPPPNPDPAAPREPDDATAWKLKGAVAALGIVAPLVAWAALTYPPIEANFETSQPTSGSLVELTEAKVETPFKAEIGSFGFSQIPPPGATEAGGRGKELLIRLRVSEPDCKELEAEIGGSCDGQPKPPHHQPERFTIRSESKWPLEALLSTTEAGVMRLGQNTDTAQPGPPGEWSLTGDASRTTVMLRCSTPTSLGVTLLPGQAHPRCAPDAATYELLIVNRQPYLPTLSLSRARTFAAEADAQLATMTAERGTLTLGGSAEEIRGMAPTEVALEATDDARVHLRLRAPTAAGVAATALTTPEAEAARLDGQDETPSRLNRNTTLRTVAFGVLATLLLTILFELLGAIGKRRETR